MKPTKATLAKSKVSTTSTLKLSELLTSKPFKTMNDTSHRLQQTGLQRLLTQATDTTTRALTIHRSRTIFLEQFLPAPRFRLQQCLLLARHYLSQEQLLQGLMPVAVTVAKVVSAVPELLHHQLVDSAAAEASVAAADLLAAAAAESPAVQPTCLATHGHHMLLIRTMVR